VRALEEWCQEDNLSLNVIKTDCGIQETAEGARPIHIDDATMEKEKSFKFLSVHVADTLKWSIHIDNVVKQVQQCLFNLMVLKKFSLAHKTLTQTHHREYPVVLYHHLVQQLHRL
jgi:hypothetical protein